MQSPVPQPSETDFHTLLLDALPELRAYARALTGNRDRADDLVHDIVVRLLAARDRYRAGTNFRAWATMILRNRFIDLRRRARFHGGSIDDLDLSKFAQPPMQDDLVYFEETVREFWRLPTAHREVLTVIGINGMSYEEAAAVLDCPVGTVRSRLARARAELQSALDANGAKRRPARPAATMAPGSAMSAARAASHDSAAAAAPALD
jgi:RNA polymerase sigma-70 factor (ECF subfamily)